MYRLMCTFLERAVAPVGRVIIINLLSCGEQWQKTYTLKAMMKKILFIAMMLLVGVVTVEAQASKEYKKQTEANRKSAEKIAKKQAKELKKQKWQSTGAVPLETLLANYYLETEAMCGGEKRGQEHTVNDAKSISMAEKRLLLDAQAAYAQEVKTMLGATLTNQASSLGGKDVESY